MFIVRDSLHPFHILAEDLLDAKDGEANPHHAHLRNVEILWSLREARYLTVELVEWLHFPQWRDRYVQY